MRITVEYERAVRDLLGNPDFAVFLQWVGKEAELANRQLIFTADEDVNVLRGRCQALSKLLMAIDKLQKDSK